MSEYSEAIEWLTYDLSCLKEDYSWREVAETVTSIDESLDLTPSYLSDEPVEAELLEPDLSKGSPK